jgi:hypothetical protein
MGGEGYEVCIMGDFNAHIGKRSGPMEENSVKVDWLGKELTNRWVEWGMEIFNESTLCEGLWTRMQGGQKTVIDYMVGSASWYNSLTRMVVEDGDVCESETDHNLIWAQFEWTRGKANGDKKLKEEWVWKMTEKTDWEGFGLEVERVVTEGKWFDIVSSIEDKEDLERHMRSWIDILRGAGVEKVGLWSRSEERAKRKWTEDLSNVKKNRKIKGKAWKRALKAGDKKGVIGVKWREYKEASEKFREEMKNEEWKEQRESMDNILKKGGGSSRSVN